MPRRPSGKKQEKLVPNNVSPSKGPLAEGAYRVFERSIFSREQKWQSYWSRGF
jgi:hypothetical protein